MEFNKVMIKDVWYIVTKVKPEQKFVSVGDKFQKVDDDDIFLIHMGSGLIGFEEMITVTGLLNYVEEYALDKVSYEARRKKLKDELKNIDTLLEGGRAVGKDHDYVEEEILTYLRILERNLDKRVKKILLYRTDKNITGMDILRSVGVELED